ncbi:pentatricopeptide repeat domain-containing protein [Rutstroemia sp. NJR-2017a BVV2]|nr:pentatricopeptide repeat domain-containing protein [Rutstroemia sp. NJR-2017a BVV2]
MSVPHICSTCRRTIGQIISGKNLRKYSAFVSLSSDPRTPAKGKQRDDYPPPANNLKARTIQPRPLVSRPEPGDALEALFEEASKKGLNEPPEIELERHIEELSEMLENRLSGKPVPLRDCWSFFLHHFGPAAWKAGTINRATHPTHLKIIAPQLLEQIMKAKSADPFSDDLPTYTELTLPFFELGILTGRDWTEMMTVLLVNILEAREPLAARQTQPLIMDLLMSWNIVCREATTEATVDISPTSLNWSYMPKIPPHKFAQASKLEQARIRKDINGASEKNINLAFSLLLPLVRLRKDGISGVALGTIKVLLDFERHGLGDSVTPDVSTLLEALLTVVHACGIEFRDLSSSALKRVPLPILQAIKDDWVVIKNRANAIVLPIMPSKRSYSSPLSGTDSNMISRRLAQAFKIRNRKAAEDSWLDAQRLPVAKLDSNDTKGVVRFVGGTLSPALYHQFILTFMGLGSPARAIEVWNHMVENDVVPGVGAWDAMINGCKVSRDAKALNEVWAKMTSSDVKPDVQCWTSRISGLIHCRAIEDGLYALDEMGRLWLQAVRKRDPNIKVSKLKEVGAISGVVKPTIVTVNAAVSGLLTQRQPAAAHRVLDWASKIGISPDVQTYNMLIRSLIREGRVNEASKLLKSMQAEEIAPDAATFVTILEDFFKDAHHQTPDELKDTVKSVFSMMEEADVEVNLHTYNKIIYLLLQANPNDMAAVAQVMEHMASRNAQPDTHTYTMLVNHYFSLQPPNLEAVRILMERARLEVGAVDHIFYDRVIEGYARAGDTSSALRLLGRIQPSRQYTSWNTLRTLLMALIRNDERNLAEELVRNTIIDKGGPIAIYEKGVEGQHKFWDLARELRLVDG